MKKVIIKNGNIVTMEGVCKKVENILIEEGRIKRINLTESQLEFIIRGGRITDFIHDGDWKTARLHQADQCEVVDLNGRTCLPGFHDSHMHMISYGFNCKYCVDLSPAKSIAEVQNILKSFIADRKISPGQWVMGMGWNQENFKGEKRLLTKEDLDAVSTEHYIFTKRVCIHIAAVNSKLLHLCGISPHTFLDNADIGRDERNIPNGIIYENAISEVVLKTKEPLSIEEIEEIIIETSMTIKSKGLTSIQSDDMKAFSDFQSKKNVIKAYDNLRRQGKLPIRVFEQIQVSGMDELLEIQRFLNDFTEDDSFSFHTIKLILDGSLGACTAALNHTYKDDAQSTGVLNFRDEELYEIVDYCYKKGFQVMCHAIGDRALEQIVKTLEALDKVYKKSVTKGSKDKRPRFVHVQIATKDLIQRMGRLQGLADIQPSFVGSDYSLIDQKLGSTPGYKLYSWKTMLESGVRVSGSSDAPVETFDPLVGIESAVTRCNLTGMPEGGWLPEEKLTVYEALHLFTAAPACCVFMERKIGQLKEGYYGDLVILNKNPFEIRPDEIHSIKVENAMCFNQ